MEKLIEYLEKKEPRYPEKYRNLIEKLSRKGKYDETSGPANVEQLEKGKAFATFYECYIYALIIGIRSNNRLDIGNGNSNKFLNFGSWKPEQVKKYIIMSLLALCEFEFNEIEELDDEQANEKANELLKLMEQYAHGGFEIIHSKMKDDPEFFEEILNVIFFLKELK